MYMYMHVCICICIRSNESMFYHMNNKINITNYLTLTFSVFCCRFIILCRVPIKQHEGAIMTPKVNTSLETMRH